MKIILIYSKTKVSYNELIVMSETSPIIMQGTHKIVQKKSTSAKYVSMLRVDYNIMLDVNDIKFNNS